MSKDERGKGELCHCCGNRCCTFYRAPAALWKRVTGGERGERLLCPRCFDNLAADKDIRLYWEAEADEFPSIIARLRERAIKLDANIASLQERMLRELWKLPRHPLCETLLGDVERIIRETQL